VVVKFWLEHNHFRW